MRRRKGLPARKSRGQLVLDAGGEAFGQARALTHRDMVVGEKLRAAGWSIERVQGSGASYVRLAEFAGRSELRADGPEFDPSEPVAYTERRIGFRTFSLMVPFVAPPAAFNLIRDIARRAQLPLHLPVLALGEAARAARDPGRARRALRGRGWTNRAIKRMPIRQVARIAVETEPLVCGFLIEATFGIAYPEKVIFGPGAFETGAWVLVSEAIRKGERFEREPTRRG